MNLMYKGIFYSGEGVKWEVQILTDWYSDEIGNLQFSGDEPLTIEWETTSKEKPICGSWATVTLISPGDRTYEELYTISVGGIRMDVFREDALYWSGTLDPEFYEEPYSTEENYEVSLTFSDFGILDRLSCDMAGMKTLQEVVEHCLYKSGLNYLGIDQHLISTSLTGSITGRLLNELMVRCDNFYDEDGEAKTLHEVLEGVLKPLAIRMIQRNGHVWMYDLNGLYGKSRPQQITWMSDDQTLGVDVVYNNAIVTWSPYVQCGNLNTDTCWTKEVDVNETALNYGHWVSYGGSSYLIPDPKPVGDSEIYSYHYDQDLVNWVDATDCGFTLWTNRAGKGATLLKDGLRFFKIVAQEDGSESEGVALFWTSIGAYKTVYSGGYHTSASMQGGGAPPTLGHLGTGVGKALWKSDAIWLPPVSNREGVRIRIGLEMLMDCRINPFESSVNWEVLKMKDHEANWNARGNFVYVPVTIKFKPDGSDNVWIWTNKVNVAQSVKSPMTSLVSTLGYWERVDTSRDNNPETWGYFCYYDVDDRKEKCGVLGWKPNRPAINPHTARLTTALAKAGGGQFVPYPTMGGAGGRLWIEVRETGWMLSDGNESLSNTEVIDSYHLWSEKTRWLLMKLPTVEVVKSTQFDEELDDDDVVYKAVLNSGAKEAIEIETICGTAKNGIALARGAYFKADDFSQITQLSRGGRTTQAEELLIGTLYSQFAQRHTKLEGTVEMLTGGLTTYSEAMQDACFMLAGEVQNVACDTSEATLIELSPDEYEKKE